MFCHVLPIFAHATFKNSSTSTQALYAQKSPHFNIETRRGWKMAESLRTSPWDRMNGKPALYVQGIPPHSPRVVGVSSRMMPNVD